MNYSKLDLAIMKKMMATINDAEKKIKRLDDKALCLDDYYRRRAEERKYTIELEKESANATIELYKENLKKKFGKNISEIQMILSADEPCLLSFDDPEPEEINEQEEDEAEDEMAVEEAASAPSNPPTEEFAKPNMEMEAPATEEEAFDPFEHLDDDEYVPSTSEPTENDLPEEVDRDEELGF